MTHLHWLSLAIPFFGTRQQLAPCSFHRKGGSGQTEDPADQIWPVGCMLSHAGTEFLKAISVSLTASTVSAVSLAGSKSFWKLLSLSGHEDSCSTLDLCAHLLSAVVHSAHSRPTQSYLYNHRHRAAL